MSVNKTSNFESRTLNFVTVTRKQLPMSDVGRWLLNISVSVLFLFATLPVCANNEIARPTVIVAVGAPGEEEFAKEFSTWAQQWQKAVETAEARLVMIGLAPPDSATDLELLQHAIASEPTNSLAELWVVFIGHGTFDGQEAKFNLRGPDLTATELAARLKPFNRPLIIINCTSASSPFLNKLSAPNRVVISATRSGYEQNFARFGKFMSEAITAREADLDKDGQTSVLEAFIMASRRTGEFYETEGRLATEHALLDDNGDGFGTPADFFRGIRAVKKPTGGGSVDGVRAHQIHLVRSAAEQQLSPETRARRDELEAAVAKLRDSKTQFSETEYYRRLENLLRELAQLYEQ